MAKTIIRIKTWRCAACDYAQDFEPSAENFALHSPGVGALECPACALKKIRAQTMRLETKTEKRITITIAGEEEIDNDEKLTLSEKEEMKKKISADIKKFKAIEA